MPASAQADKGKNETTSAGQRVVGAALSADVDASTKQVKFCMMDVDCLQTRARSIGWAYPDRHSHDGTAAIKPEAELESE